MKTILNMPTNYLGTWFGRTNAILSKYLGEHKKKGEDIKSLYRTTVAHHCSKASFL